MLPDECQCLNTVVRFGQNFHVVGASGSPRCPPAQWDDHRRPRSESAPSPLVVSCPSVALALRWWTPSSWQFQYLHRAGNRTITLWGEVGLSRNGKPPGVRIREKHVIL